MNTLWLKNNRVILNLSGQPQLCAECPCADPAPQKYSGSHPHYAYGTSTAWEIINQITAEIDGKTFHLDLVFTSRTYGDSVAAEVITGYTGLYGWHHSANFRSQGYESALANGGDRVTIGFDLFLTEENRDGKIDNLFFNVLQISGGGRIYDGSNSSGKRLDISGVWRNQTGNPVSQNGTVTYGVPLPFSMEPAIPKGTVNSNASKLTGGVLEHQSSSNASCTISGSRCDKTIYVDGGVEAPLPQNFE